MSTVDALLIIFAMTLITYATRAGGIFLVGFVPMSARVEAFLRYLAGSVLVAIVVPATVRGGAAAYVAVAVAVVGTLVLRKALPAIALGILAAALWRAYMG
ncbi:AzlD domain-containing protein [Starkeya sp. 3C]|uniref:AzlD domain-containing protein n=1 Tax=Ancylobacter moscoviensis TaxID=2597768 RepID=A0ABY3DS31_9HYPH|nr:AzlD domain-containing protein [Ancylobacter moscoviensis]TSJ62856.1 AzlD domain-containing protein [Ancylobacter moscoviensis]